MSGVRKRQPAFVGKQRGPAGHRQLGLPYPGPQQKVLFVPSRLHLGHVHGPEPLQNGSACLSLLRSREVAWVPRAPYLARWGSCCQSVMGACR